MTRLVLSFGLAVALVAQFCGCAHVRFADQPVVWSVDDRQDVAEPKERPYHAARYMADVLLLRGLPRALSLPDKEPAWNTNALDELPASSWWNHRLAVRPLSPEEVAVGPATGGPPQLPLTVVAGKGGGGNPGFLAKDATGRTFLIKFDRPENPEMQTATGIIVNRLFWALGYNVPADTLFHFHPDDLRIAPEAVHKDEIGKKQPLDRAAIDDLLRVVPRTHDGRIRALASEFLPGTPKGGVPMMGRRKDDPNDRIPHQHRREMRALRVFAAWTGHTDMKEDNTLSMYVEEDGRRFLRHYLLDFGEAFGAHRAEKDRPDDGHVYFVDLPHTTAALFSFGLWERRFERAQPSPYLSVGTFDAKEFRPEKWKEAYPWWPFAHADRADLYWGARLVMSFTRPMIEAAVEAGQLSHPGAEEWLVEALVGRQRIIGQTWLEAVSPLDRVVYEDGRLCMTDMGVHFGLADTGVVERLPVRYDPRWDDDGPAGSGVEGFTVAPDGRVCLPPSTDSGYLVDRLRVRRGRDRKPVMQVHYRPGPDGRVLGIIRVEEDVALRSARPRGKGAPPLRER